MIGQTVSRYRIAGVNAIENFCDGGINLKLVRPRKTSAAFIEPMLLVRSDTLPEGPNWAYELKLDGYRALAVRSGGGVEFRSRNDTDFNARR